MSTSSHSLHNSHPQDEHALNSQIADIETSAGIPETDISDAGAPDLGSPNTSTPHADSSEDLATHVTTDEDKEPEIVTAAGTNAAGDTCPVDLPDVEDEKGSTAEFIIPQEMLFASEGLSKEEKKLDKLPLAWAAKSDVGNVRPHNEDSFLVQPPLFVVCDGMGGHEGGEVASALAVESIAKSAPNKADDTALGVAIENANLAIIRAVEQGEGKPGMGTTATAALIEHDHIAIAHVGDSRCYILHEGALTRVTRDHSVVEELVEQGEITADEARTHPARSIITRALGSDVNMYADHFTLPVELGDRVLLCSDGLSSMIEDHIIQTIMSQSKSAQECVDRLVERALSAGGLDNITCLVVEVIKDKTSTQAHISTMKAVLLWVASLLMICAIGAGALTWYANQSWYVSDTGGLVTVHRGIPGNFAGISLSSINTMTNIPVDKLPESVQKRLASGVHVDSLEDAEKLLASYREQIAQREKDAQTTQQNIGQQGTDSAEITSGTNTPSSSGAASSSTSSSTAPAQSSSASAPTDAGGESR